MTHTFLGETIDFNLIYKKRKTMGIYIDVYGHIELRVPKTTSEETIHKMLENKWEWILKKTKEMQDRTAGFKEKTYETGEDFLYLGKAYPIVISYNPDMKQDYVEFDADKLRVNVITQDEDRIKKALKHFYYQQCKAVIEARIRVYQNNFKTKPKSIRIAYNKSNWGTCDSKFQLTFNWRLSMAPIEVIDYVVVHEMCHMIHLNHDRSFWRLVGKILPDYENRQKWLAISSWKMVV